MINRVTTLETSLGNVISGVANQQTAMMSSMQSMAA